jgi:predicted transcriptional regulator
LLGSKASGYNAVEQVEPRTTMSEKVTVELPDELAQRARAIAARTERPVEEVLVDWIRRGGAQPVLELLSDEELLAVCDGEMDAAQQEELGELLEHAQEGSLGEAERVRLEELMRGYRSGLVRKAQALKIAVTRGLRPRLS